MKRTIHVLLCVAGIVPVILSEANAQSNTDVRHLLKRLEENSDRFAKSFDSALDHSTLNGSRTEDEMNAYVHEFEEATDRLKDHYEDRGSDPDSAREVFLRARGIDSFMRRYRMGPRATGDWEVVRSDLDAWARCYNLIGTGRCNPQLLGMGVRRASCQTTNTSVRQASRVRVAKSTCGCRTASARGR